ncbi:MAG: Cd(II)/Pb(II)-responsive transcriptional regulator [Betaproteobacteria bacterium]|nr:Cd(II)/Pb(II)-responsive transcriptional regulator [Betaproteobacteria bacterium]
MKIGELAKRTDCQIGTIRYYEKAGLLPEPMRSTGNFRLYGEAHVERLHFIRHCRSLDMTLDEVLALLQFRDSPQADCGEVNELLDRHIQQIGTRMEALSQLKLHLTALRENCTGHRPTETCGILQGLTDCSSHQDTSDSVSVR